MCWRPQCAQVPSPRRVTWPEARGQSLSSVWAPRPLKSISCRKRLDLLLGTQELGVGVRLARSVERLALGVAGSSLQGESHEARAIWRGHLHTCLGSSGTPDRAAPEPSGVIWDGLLVTGMGSVDIEQSRRLPSCPSIYCPRSVSCVENPRQRLGLEDWRQEADDHTLGLGPRYEVAGGQGVEAGLLSSERHWFSGRKEGGEPEPRPAVLGRRAGAWV